MAKISVQSDSDYSGASLNAPAGGIMEVGITLEKRFVVEEHMTAKAVGSGLLKVLSTPSMIAAMENTAYKSVEPYLEEDQGTVGTEVHAKHLASAPMGAEITVRSTLTEIDRRALTFEIEVTSGGELIGTAMHKRFIISKSKFLAKSAQK